MLTTDGGRANGIPRKRFVPLAVVPVNVPPSSLTIGPVGCLVGAAKPAVIAAQMVASNAGRNFMTTKEKNWRVPGGTSGHLHISRL